jgi:hypothetical protein
MNLHKATMNLQKATAFFLLYLLAPLAIVWSIVEITKAF